MSLGGSANPPKADNGTMGVFPTPIWMQTSRCRPLWIQTLLDADPPGCSPTWIQTPWIQTPRCRPLDADLWSCDLKRMLGSQPHPAPVDRITDRRFWKHYLPLALADLRGGRQGRAPPESKFFHFHAVFSKNLKNNSNFGSWRTPLGKILDPPLLAVGKDTSCNQVSTSSNILMSTIKTSTLLC